jgi:acyl carrier protein
LPLISSGIIDSIATAKLILFLEERFKVEFKAHEVSVDYLNCINDIAATVSAKMAG